MQQCHYHMRSWTFSKILVLWKSHIVGVDEPNLERHATVVQSMETPFKFVTVWGDGVRFSWDKKRNCDAWIVLFLA